jgi:predicted RNA binding protein YcfA (HicA-like mRNA interferase family)
VSKLPAISGAECIKALGEAGFVTRGSHTTMVRDTPPAQTTIPLHKELDKGTLRAIIRQAGFTRGGVRLALVILPKRFRRLCSTLGALPVRERSR